MLSILKTFYFTLVFGLYIKITFGHPLHANDSKLAYFDSRRELVLLFLNSCIVLGEPVFIYDNQMTLKQFYRFFSVC